MRFPTISAFLLLSAIATLLTVSPKPAGATVGGELARYERNGWPPALATIELPRGRSYVVVLQVPTVRPFDMSDVDGIRDTILANMIDAPGWLGDKRLLGHSVVAWQCRSGRGVAAMTGESRGQGLMMAVAGGWGATPLLSVYLDGKVLRDGASFESYAKAMARGEGAIVAFEVTERDCQAMRAFLSRFITHPDRPSRRYGLLLDPMRFEGGGCTSFALALIAHSRIWRGGERAAYRRIELHDGVLGRRMSTPPGVLPYRTARSPGDERIVPFGALYLRSWKSGAFIENVRIVDPELLFAMLVELRIAAGETDGWRVKRRVSGKDPAVAAAIAEARRIVARYPKRRFLAPDGYSVLVLER
ncbi:MAG TPA: hypothetical protein GX405_19080 [Rhizobiales bacterium]|nr:hypothetical protein [Hyphomicrobiales bacterium]